MHSVHIDEMTVAVLEKLPEIVREITASPESPETAQRIITEALQGYWKDKVADIWNTTDVIEYAAQEGYTVNEEQAIEVLELFFNDFDANSGLNWNTLHFAWSQYLGMNPDIDRIEGFVFGEDSDPDDDDDETTRGKDYSSFFN